LEFISKMTFARLLIPRLFPETVRRVLYLDADLLVFDDLDPLWEADLEGAVLGAVLDGLDLHLKKNGKPGLEGMPRVRNYFNSGVLLIDLPRWRKEQISERSLDYLTRHPRSPFSDQDALNVACDGLWKRLDPRWNFQNHHQTSILDMGPQERPAVVHFVTSVKPWKPSSLSVNASLYDAVRSRTCFARTRRDRLSDAVQTMWRRLKLRLRQFLGVVGPSAAE
jgi:lipopolysaccharide biosynthesis glycosyltransferase